MGGYPGRSRRSGPFWPMRRLQAGLFPEARRRIGKCLDCGEDGAVGGVGEGFGFLVVAGACAQAREPLLATRTTKAKKSDRARKGMRLNKSSAQRIPRGRRHAQIAISRECESVSELPTIRPQAGLSKKAGGPNPSALCSGRRQRGHTRSPESAPG